MSHAAAKIGLIEAPTQRICHAFWLTKSLMGSKPGTARYTIFLGSLTSSEMSDWDMVLKKTLSTWLRYACIRVRQILKFLYLNSQTNKNTSWTRIKSIELKRCDLQRWFNDGTRYMHHESQDHTVIIRVFRAENLQVGPRSCHELYLVSHQRWVGACSSNMPKMQQNDEVPVAGYLHIGVSSHKQTTH